MQVLAGKYKNAKLNYPGGATHPMGARQKLALFNMVDVTGARVLDAFAGSGALGIEALSQGATQVVFVDDAIAAVRVIRENLQGLGLMKTPAAKVVKRDLFDFVTDEPFDVILADPPYTDFRVEVIERIVRFLKPGGILALSHPERWTEASKGADAHGAARATVTAKRAHPEAPELPGLTLETSRSYAGAKISIYRKN